MTSEPGADPHPSSTDPGPPPVFVGGTGRSGTTVVARLIAAHPAYRMVPSELRFHAESSGLPGLLAGRLDPAWVTDQLRTHWARRRGADGKPRGVTTVMAPADYAIAVDRFERGRRQDSIAAGRELVAAVVHASLPADGRAAGPGGWVEMTPPNLEAAGELAMIFPEARFVHTIRSGLEVACSMQRHAWAPDEAGDCLLWWEDRFARADAGARSLPPGALHEIHLERLADPGSRDRVVLELLAFLGLDDAPAVREFRETAIADRAATASRWRALPSGPRAELLASYRQALGRLRRRGARTLPVDADAGSRWRPPQRACELGAAGGD
jgi:hypothetical protein